MCTELILGLRGMKIWADDCQEMRFLGKGNRRDFKRMKVREMS